jgi:hypothetical protein
MRVPSRLAFLASHPKDAKVISFSHALRSYSSAILAVSFPINFSKIGASLVLIGLTFIRTSLFSVVRSLVEWMVANIIERKPILIFIALTLVVGGLNVC